MTAASHRVIDPLRLCLQDTLSPQPGIPPFSATSKIPSLGHNKTPGVNLSASVFPQHLKITGLSRHIALNRGTRAPVRGSGCMRLFPSSLSRNLAPAGRKETTKCASEQIKMETDQLHEQSSADAFQSWGSWNSTG